MGADDVICSNGPASQRLSCSGIHIIEGVTLEKHIFLVSQLPCCAQLALPYWAKITGRIVNNQAEEVLLTVAVTLLHNDGSMLADYADVIALDGGQKVEFEVKLIEQHDSAKSYALTIKEMEQF